LASETPLIEEQRAAGARLAEFAGVLLPETFSDFQNEYGAARTCAALFDTSWHAVLILTGRDRVQYLHNISSNDIKSLVEGRGTLALLLNPQGRILAELEIYALLDQLLVLSHASHRDHTVTTLRKYVIGSQVQIQDLTEQVGSFAIEGPRAAAIIGDSFGVTIEGLAEMSVREVSLEGAPCYVIRRAHFGGIGVELVAPRNVLPALWRKALAAVRAGGGAAIGMAALESLRLEAGIPRFPVDFNDGMIPHEAALETTHISFMKGCYTGQEIVERVRSRGHVNRRRALLKFSGSDAPVAGTKLRASDAEVGYVTSAAFSPAAGTAIGMGYVRREQFAPGSVVEFDDGTATVTS